MAKFTCLICNKEFEAIRKSAVCPECKATPAICVICGKEFERKHPYTQKTCSSKCRGEYRKKSGIAKSVSEKMKQTKLERYGTLDPAEVAKKKKGSDLDPKACKWCGKMFVPDSPRQIYCKETHYGACPVCGNRVEIKDLNIGPQACSEKCRLERISSTCEQKYGAKYAVISDHAKELAKQTNLKKYGEDHYSKTDEYKERFKQTSLERYGTEFPMQSHEIKERAKEGNKSKYGVESHMQTPEGKAKVKAALEDKYGGVGLASQEIRNKAVATNKERYGVEFPMSNPEVVEKLKSNNLQKYGTEWAATTPEANEKRKLTNLERYGAENVFGSQEIQERSRATCIEKYGGPNAMHNPELARITSERQQQSMINKYGVNASVLVPEIQAKMIATNMERYGVPWYGMSQEAAIRTISQVNKKFAADLGHLGILTTFEFSIGSRRYDLKIAESNTVVEINPTYTHNAYYSPYGEPHDPNYHLMKSRLAEENGFRCIHVFDWDDHLAIFNLLKQRRRIFARKCSIQQLDRKTAEIFTAQYHLQGSCRGQNIVYGLYYKGELVQLVSFGSPRYNKKYDFELLRLCTSTGVEVVGGPSRLFNKFQQDFPGKSVLSYCDYAKFSGKVYNAIGMTLSHTTPPAKIWSKGSRYITDNYLRQRGYDQIFKTNYGKGTSNEQLMLDNGWAPVYDCGQKVFVYIPE